MNEKSDLEQNDEEVKQDEKGNKSSLHLDKTSNVEFSENTNEKSNVEEESPDMVEDVTPIEDLKELEKDDSKPVKELSTPLIFSLVINVILVVLLVGLYSIHLISNDTNSRIINSKDKTISQLEETIKNPEKVKLPKASQTYEIGKDSSPCEVFEKEKVFCLIDWEYSSVIKKGFLISQKPEVGEKSLQVKLTYSLGLDSIVLPDYAGAKINDVEEKVKSLGLQVGGVKKVSVPNFSKDTIIETFPKAGEKLVEGDKIYFIVSDETQVNVPDWTNKTQEYVQAQADSLGIKVEFKEEESTETSGLVIKQSNTGSISPENVVIVTISKAKEQKVVIPKVVGLSKEEAITQLTVDGFLNISLEYKETDSSNKENTVLKVNPKEGTKLDVNDKVTVTLSGSK